MSGVTYNQSPHAVWQLRTLALLSILVRVEYQLMRIRVGCRMLRRHSWRRDMLHLYREHPIEGLYCDGHIIYARCEFCQRVVIHGKL